MLNSVSAETNPTFFMRTDQQAGVWDGSATDAFDDSPTMPGLSADEAGAAVVDAFGDIAMMADGKNGQRDTLAMALDGLTVDERKAAGGTDSIDAVLDEALLFSGDMIGSDFVLPEIIIAEHGDINNPPEGVEHLLPDGVYGAFVPPTDETEGGTIFLSAELTNDPENGEPSLSEVALEEVGEAFADYAFTQGVDLADGDVGTRIVKVARHEPLVEADFDSSLQDEITLMLNGELVTAKAALVVPVPEPDSPYEFALFTSYLGKPGEGLTSADYTTLANEYKLDGAEWGEYGLVSLDPASWSSADIVPAVTEVINNHGTFGSDERWSTGALKADLGLTDQDIATLRSEYDISYALDATEIAALPGEVFYLRADETVGVNTADVAAGGIPISESHWVPQNYVRDHDYSWTELVHTYAAPIDLKADWDPSNNPVVISHRGVFENARNVPENSIASITAALEPDSGLNAVEIDIVSTADGELIVSHDFSPWRQTTLYDGEGIAQDRKWSELQSGDVLGQEIITRDISEDGEYTGDITYTGEKVMTLETAMDAGVGVNNDAVFYVDARNDDPGRTIAMLANDRPDLAARAVIKVYPFDEDLKHYGGEELLAEVRAALPEDSTVTAEEALGMVQINPVVVPAKIGEIATYRANDQGVSVSEPPTFDEKVTWTMDWLRSFESAGAEVYTFQPVIDGTGAYYSEEFGTVQGISSIEGMPVLTTWQLANMNAHPATVLNVENDAVNMRIGDMLREESPEIALMGGYRMDDFSTGKGTDNEQHWIFNPGNGSIVEVEKNWSLLGPMFLSTPGNPAIQKYGDIILTDNPDQEMMDLDGADQFWDQSNETTDGIEANRRSTGVIGVREDSVA